MLLELKPIEGQGVDTSMLNAVELQTRLDLIDAFCKAYTSINEIEYMSIDDFDTVCKMDNRMLQEALDCINHIRMVKALNDFMSKLNGQQED
jgi:hypothetical protein